MARYINTPKTSLKGINAELVKVQDAFEDVLDRRGDGANFLDTDLDMNSQRILNLPEPVHSQEPVRLGDVKPFIDETKAARDAAVEAAGVAQESAEASATSASSAEQSTASAANSAAKAKDTVQSFVDSFALKIFQSPTDGGLTEIQTRTVSGGEVYEVRKTSDGEYATIYRDAAGTVEISQNGTDNKSGSNGVVEFFIDDGDYYLEVNGKQKGFSVGNKKTEFDKVSEAKTYNKIDKLLGSRVYLKDRKAYFDVVLTSSVTPNDLDIIQSSENALYSLSCEIGKVTNLTAIGGAGDGAQENLSVILRSLENHYSTGLPIDTGDSLNNFFFSGDIPITQDVKFIGDGKLSSSVVGVRPDESALTSAADSSERLSLFDSYYNGSISLSAGVSLSGGLSIGSALLKSSGGKVILRGALALDNSAAHGIEFDIEKDAALSGNETIATDSSGIGFFVKGHLSDDTLLVLYSGNDNIRLHRGGTVESNNGVSLYAGLNGVFFWFGGFMSGKNFRTQYNARHGVVNNYSASADFENIICSYNTLTNCVCETGGTFYSINGDFSNSVNGSGIFINGAEMNAKNAVIKNNSSLGVDGRYDFYLDISNANIDMSNNAGGVQVRSLGGDITAIKPQTGNAINLTEDGYSPLFNSGSMTGGKIGDINPSKYTNELGGVVFKSNTSTISSGDLSITSTRQLVQCESGVVDSITGVVSDIDLSFVFPDTTGQTITVTHNSGNVRTVTGADIVMDSPNRGCQVVRADTLFFFIPLFS